MICVDTSAWYAIFSRRDVNHAAAPQTIRSVREQLVTSDYVVSETLTLLRARGENHRALLFGQRVVEGGWAMIERMEEQDFAETWRVFQTFRDKSWSFTDCSSRVLMERLAITRAFAFDEHFRQFATVTVIP
jgi:predicted nucleic acid-binding protein